MYWTPCSCCFPLIQMTVLELILPPHYSYLQTSYIITCPHLASHHVPCVIRSPLKGHFWPFLCHFSVSSYSCSDLVDSSRLCALSGSFSTWVSLLPFSVFSFVLCAILYLLCRCFASFRNCGLFYFCLVSLYTSFILLRSLSSFSLRLSLSFSLSLAFHFLMPRFALHFVSSLMPVSVFFICFATKSGQHCWIYLTVLTGLEVFMLAFTVSRKVTFQSVMSGFIIWMDDFWSKDITFFEFYIDWLSRPTTLLWCDWNLMFWGFYWTAGFIMDRKATEPSRTVFLWN